MDWERLLVAIWCVVGIIVVATLTIWIIAITNWLAIVWAIIVWAVIRFYSMLGDE